MSDQNSQQEPSMEEILASIRRIISEEVDEEGAAAEDQDADPRPGKALEERDGGAPERHDAGCQAREDQHLRRGGPDRPLQPVEVRAPEGRAEGAEIFGTCCGT